jgi:hypothetical protein
VYVGLQVLSASNYRSKVAEADFAEEGADVHGRAGGRALEREHECC